MNNKRNPNCSSGPNNSVLGSTLICFACLTASVLTGCTRQLAPGAGFFADPNDPFAEYRGGKVTEVELVGRNRRAGSNFAPRSGGAGELPSKTKETEKSNNKKAVQSEAGGVSQLGADFDKAFTQMLASVPDPATKRKVLKAVNREIFSKQGSNEEPTEIKRRPVDHAGKALTADRLRPKNNDPLNLFQPKKKKDLRSATAKTSIENRKQEQLATNLSLEEAGTQPIKEKGPSLLASDYGNGGRLVSSNPLRQPSGSNPIRPSRHGDVVAPSPRGTVQGHSHRNPAESNTIASTQNRSNGNPPATPQQAKRDHYNGEVSESDLKLAKAISKYREQFQSNSQDGDRATLELFNMLMSQNRNSFNGMGGMNLNGTNPFMQNPASSLALANAMKNVSVPIANSNQPTPQGQAAGSRVNNSSPGGYPVQPASYQPAGMNPPAAANHGQPFSNGNWKQSVVHVINDMKARVDGSMNPNEKNQLLVNLSVLYLIANDQDSAMRTLEQLPAESKEFWTSQIFSLAQFMQPSGDGSGATLAGNRLKADRALPELEKAISSLSKMAHLKVVNPQFCTEVVAFGRYTLSPTVTFSSGEEVIVYCELENYHVEKNTDTRGNQFTTILEPGWEIVDQNGQRVDQFQYKKLVDRCSSRRDDFHVLMPLRIPNLKKGRYKLVATMHDVQGKKFGSSIPLEFSVR